MRQFRSALLHMELISFSLQAARYAVHQEER
jgi:hypothetical protein